MKPVPAALATADPRVVRPRDLRGVYARPAKELQTLAEQNTVLKLRHGYYALVPEHLRAYGSWRPTLEGAGLAIGQADYGHDDVALMGMTAARALGAVPRAQGTVLVAVPRQRPAMNLDVGRVQFVVRRVRTLDVQRIDTDLAEGWVTTPTQTLLDLVDRPDLGGFTCADVQSATRWLARRAERQVLARLAKAQRKVAAGARALALLDAQR